MNLTQPITDTARTMQQAARAGLDFARSATFAGLGVVAVLQEEAASMYDRLVSEGRAVEAGRASTFTARAYVESKDEAREVQSEAAVAVERVERSAEQAGRTVEARAKAFEDQVARAVTAALQRMNVPTREDVDALKRSVERLDPKTAELRAA